MAGHCSSVGVPSSVGGRVKGHGTRRDLGAMRPDTQQPQTPHTPCPAPSYPRISENPLQLVVHVVAGEEGPPRVGQLCGEEREGSAGSRQTPGPQPSQAAPRHRPTRPGTCKDAAGRPHVDGGGVELGAEEHVRGPVPQRDDLRGTDGQCAAHPPGPGARGQGAAGGGGRWALDPGSTEVRGGARQSPHAPWHGGGAPHGARAAGAHSPRPSSSARGCRRRGPGRNPPA